VLRVPGDEQVIELSPPQLDHPSRSHRRARLGIQDVFLLLIALVFASAAATIAVIVLASVVTLVRHALL
jgi:hypothetical protein